MFLLLIDLDDIDRGTAVSAELLWRESRSVWCARFEPLWADFCGARATNYKPAPLLDATPLTAWVYLFINYTNRPYISLNKLLKLRLKLWFSTAPQMTSLKLCL